MTTENNIISHLCFDGNLEDTNGLVWNPVGNINFDTTIKKSGTGSIHFEGNQYLKLEATEAVAFGFLSISTSNTLDLLNIVEQLTRSFF